MKGNQNFKIDSKVFKWVPTSVCFFNFPMEPGCREKAIHTTRHGTLPLPHPSLHPSLPIEDSGAQPTHDFLSGFLPVFLKINFWWSLPRVILTQDAKYTHRALSGALSGPDSAALRRTLWFCCRVWLFDCRKLFKYKEKLTLFIREIYASHSYYVHVEGSRPSTTQNLNPLKRH
jgi:hypothetical protein